MPDLSRYDDVLTWLRARAAADAAVRVVWIGGSAVTGGWDEWSDLDVEVLCAPGTAVATYAAWLSGIRASFAVHDVWELPESTWPDGRQCFVTLQPLGRPTRLLDLHVAEPADHHARVDVRRHGRPLVLHDPDGLVVFVDEDTSSELAAAVEQVRQRRVTGQWLVDRAIARGHVAEAVDLYLRFPLAGVVRLLRAEHCPWRHDFGLRYLRADLPQDVAERVEALVPGAGPLEELSAACFTWLDELLAQ